MRFLFMLLVFGGVATLRAELSFVQEKNGRVETIQIGDNLAASGVALAIPNAGWKNNLYSPRKIRLLASKDVEGGREIHNVSETKGQEAFRVVTRVIRTSPSRLEFTYEITAQQALVPAAVICQLRFPIDKFSGKEYVAAGEQGIHRAQFPREKPNPYSFFNSHDFDWIAWRVGNGYALLTPDWETTQNVNLQDNRQFNGSDYELQIYSLKNHFGKGEKTTVGYALEEVGEKELSARLKKIAPQKDLSSFLLGNAPAAIHETIFSQRQLATYERLEITIRADGIYQNPFDPKEIKLDAEVIDPDGKRLVVPAYFHADYARSFRSGREHMTLQGTPGWRVRFCPKKAGRHRCRILLENREKRIAGEWAEFNVTASTHPGMIRVAKKNPLMFETESGAPYFAIGENVCWPSRRGIVDYDNYWKRLSENRANYARLWIGPFDCFTLERNANSPKDPAGLGRIDQIAAARVDYVMDLAEKYGIRIMFCIESFNSLRSKKPHNTWARNPYNAANGGPLEIPNEFFTNKKARELFKNRLRYIVARWGWHPTLLSWEFWNEVNIVDNYQSETAVSWHREMGRYLREIDPYDHLVTTSWAGDKGDPQVDALPELDYIQSHRYGPTDFARYITAICKEKNETFHKPHYVGEYGTGTRAQGTLDDTTGIHLHNGLWAGLLGNSAATGMLWWWDNYVDPMNLYHLFLPIADFTADLPLNTVRYQPAKCRFAWRGEAPPPRWRDLALAPSKSSWRPAIQNTPQHFNVFPDGRKFEMARLTKVLHGTKNHPELHNPVSFEIDYHQDGVFFVAVGDVSGYGGARLQIFLDGNLLCDKDFVDSDKHTETITRYRGKYQIAVPAGKHQIKVENIGADWILIEGYHFPGYLRLTHPPLHGYALVTTVKQESAPVALVWLKHEDYNWHAHNVLGYRSWKIPAGINLTLEDLPDGVFQIEFWDTHSGVKTKGNPISIHNGTATIQLPSFDKSIALKILP